MRLAQWLRAVAPAVVAVNVKRSGIREIMDLAWATPGCIHLEACVGGSCMRLNFMFCISTQVGQPDFPTPAHIIAAAKQSLDAGNTR